MKISIFLIVLMLFLHLNGEEEEKSEVDYSIDSKNKVNVYRDEKLNKGGRADSYTTLSSETFIEGSYGNYALGLKKHALIFLAKDYDKQQHPYYNYRYTNELFNHGWEQYITRAYINGNFNHVNIQAGDFYKSLNRGLFFNFTNNTRYGDSSIRGTNVDFVYKRLKITAFGGKANPYLRDEVTQQRMRSVDDYVWGTEISYKLSKVQAGIEYGGVIYDDYDINRQPATNKTYERIDKSFHLLGTFIEAKNILPKSNIYVGATIIPSGQGKRWITSDATFFQEFSQDLDLSHAIYLSMLKWFDIGKNRLTIQLEGKNYYKYFTNYLKFEEEGYVRRYFNPPSLIDDKLGLLNDFDTIGGRVKISYNDKTLTKSKYNISFSMGVPHNQQEVTHDTYVLNDSSKDYLPSSKSEMFGYKKEDYYLITLSTKKNFASLFYNISGMYFYAHDPDDKKTVFADEETKRVWTNINAIIGGNFGKFSYKFNSDFFIKDEKYSGTQEYFNAKEIKNSLDLSYASRYILALQSTYWYNPKDSITEKEFYPGVMVGYNYRWIRATLFGGMTRGGWDCSGGTCRFVPEFKGVKFELDFKI